MQPTCDRPPKPSNHPAITMDFDNFDYGSDFEEDFEDNFGQAPRSPQKDILTRRLYKLEDSPLSLIPEPIVKEIPKDAKLSLKQLDALPSKYQHLVGDIKEFNFTQSVVFDTVFGSDNCVAVCAPTGSGKTLIFELAIIKAISDHGKVHKN